MEPQSQKSYRAKRSLNKTKRPAKNIAAAARRALPSGVLREEPVPIPTSASRADEIGDSVGSSARPNSGFRREKPTTANQP
jgi:hypothetical protein